MSHHVANKLLSGETLPELVPLDEHWKTARKEMTKRQNEAYERAANQWFGSRNEDKANTQAAAFKPLFNEPEPEPEILTPGRVLIGVLVALGGVTGFFMWLLANYR